MIKIFLTGDNHFGRKFEGYKEEIRSEIINKRYESFENAVKKANDEKCDFFVIAGDLFERLSNISKKDIEEVINCLKKFNNDVLIIPGNHDFYTGSENLWEVFKKEIEGIDNIKLYTEYKKDEIDLSSGDKVVFYPAYCDSKHSEENRLDYIRDSEIDENAYNICIAHGAVEGLSLDKEGKYFCMSDNDLEGIGMDCCLIGHTHVPYPKNLTEEDKKQTTIYFNAGTHSQLDVGNNTDGECFIITIDKNKKTTINAKKYVSGIVRFYDIEINDIDDDKSLEKIIDEKLKEEILSDKKNAIVRLKLKGVVNKEDYENKESICQKFKEEYMYFEYDYKELEESITIERIKKEFAETSFAVKFLESLKDNKRELSKAYRLVKESIKK